MTNRERLETMSDKELAKWLCIHLDCTLCPFRKDYPCIIGKYKLQDWLKMENNDDWIVWS